MDNAALMPITYQQAVANPYSAKRPVVWPRWGIADSALAIGGFVVIAVLVGLPLWYFNAPLELVVLVGGIAPWLMLGGWPIIATLLRGNGPRIDLGIIMRWSDVGWGLLFGVAGLVAAGFGALITTLFVGDFNSAAGEVALALQESNSLVTLFVFAVMIAIGAPVVEELAFRGLLYGSLRKKGIGSIWVVVITAAAFALFHLEPVRFLVLFPIGLTLGLARWKTQGLGAPMVAHLVNNLPAAVFLLIGAGEVTP